MRTPKKIRLTEVGQSRCFKSSYRLSERFNTLSLFRFDCYNPEYAWDDVDGSWIAYNGWLIEDTEESQG